LERERAEQALQRERDNAIEDLRREFTGLAVTAAERVIESAVDGEGHRQLIENVLEEGLQDRRN
jgi:F0F1-type ATP synthase membrane subunit b/b'